MNKIRQQSPLSEAKPARIDNQMEWATKNLNLDVKRTIDRGSLMACSAMKDLERFKVLPNCSNWDFSSAGTRMVKTSLLICAVDKKNWLF